MAAIAIGSVVALLLLVSFLRWWQTDRNLGRKNVGDEEVELRILRVERGRVVERTKVDGR
jgi:hypothetical protein